MSAYAAGFVHVNDRWGKVGEGVKLGVGYRESGIGRRETEVGGRVSGVGGRETEVRGREAGNGGRG